MKNFHIIAASFLFGIIIVMIGAFFYVNWIGGNWKQEVAKAERKFQVSDSLRKSSSKRADSLSKEASMYSKYRTLNLAITHRDNATSTMEFKVGEAAYLKTDSTRVIVSDIFIGGSTNEYYVKYKVTFKDNHTQEFIPELLFKR